MSTRFFANSLNNPLCILYLCIISLVILVLLNTTDNLSVCVGWQSIAVKFSSSFQSDIFWRQLTNLGLNLRILLLFKSNEEKHNYSNLYQQCHFHNEILLFHYPKLSSGSLLAVMQHKCNLSVKHLTCWYRKGLCILYIKSQKSTIALSDLVSIYKIHATSALCCAA
jgi:hypothetical protein